MSTGPKGSTAVWSLYIVDNDVRNSGTLNGGWSLMITTANADPRAEPGQFRVKAGKTLNVSDLDGDLLTAELADSPNKGGLSLLPDGSFTYKVRRKAKGKDSFSYLTQDPDGDDGLATVSIKIKGKK